MSDGTAAGGSRRATGVQSVHRALDLVEILAAGGGRLSLSDIADRTVIPVPTIHRLLRTLVERGYVRQLSNRQYALGLRLVPLGATANSLAGVDTEAILAGLVDEMGESANVAVLAGNHAEYVAQASAPRAMRMFTEIGRRVELHCTGVGKALMAQLSDREVEGIVHGVGLRAHTEHTITTSAELAASLRDVRRLGYALDEQEQEIGIRCVAVPVPTEAGVWMAISVSGPLPRMTDAVIERAVPLLQSAASQLAASMAPG